MTAGTGPPAGDLPSPSQPRHLALLLRELQAEGKEGREVLDLALLVGEALLKTVTGILYSAIVELDGERAAEMRSGLGTSGTWVTRLRDLAGDTALDSASPPVQGLVRWLSDRDLEWVRLTTNRLALALTVSQAFYSPPLHPTVMDALDAVIQLRNRRAHGGLIADEKLAVAAANARDAVAELASRSPAGEWTWAISDGGSWHLVIGVEDPPPTLDTTTMPEPSPAPGLFLWSGVSAPLRCRDLLRGELGPARILCLNGLPRSKGTVDYLDYSTNEVMQDRFERPQREAPVNRTLAWLDEEVPVPLVKLRGRDAFLEEIERDIGKGRRLLTIVAPSGMGKTTVAAEIARRAAPARRPYLAHCEQWPDHDQLLSQVLLPLRERLAGKPSTLILDSLETALDGPAGDVVRRGVQDLVSHLPELVLLSTSLRPIELPGESRYPLLPLEGLPVGGEKVADDDITMFPAAQQLIDRVRDTDVHYRVTQSEAPAIRVILTWLGGHPLATQLVAPYLALRGAAEVAEQLPRMMSDAIASHEPGRHRSVEAALAYSLEPLPEAERLILVALAVPWVVSSRQMLLTLLAGSTGTRQVDVDACLDELERRRLIGRVDVRVEPGPAMKHMAVINHPLIRAWVRARWGTTDLGKHVERAGLAYLTSVMQAQLAQDHETCCSVCSWVEEKAADFAIQLQEEFQDESRGALISLGLAYTRLMVDGTNEGELDPPDAADMILALVHPVSMGPLYTSSSVLDARVQAMRWLTPAFPDDPDFYLAQSTWLIGDLVNAGRSDEAVELAEECVQVELLGSDADQALEVLEHLRRAGRTPDAVRIVDGYVGGAFSSFADLYSVSEAWDELADPLLQWKVRWVRGHGAAAERADALLRRVRWLLIRASTTRADRESTLREARMVARRAHVWCHRSGSDAGVAEAVVAEALTEFHLSREAGRWRGLLDEVALGADSAIGSFFGAQPGEAGQAESAITDLRLAAVHMHLRGGDGSSLLPFFAPARAAEAVEHAEQGDWANAARCVGLAEACLRGRVPDEAVRSHLDQARARIEQQVGRGAATIAISEVRDASPDEILRRLGFWVPGDPLGGFAALVTGRQ